MKTFWMTLAVIFLPLQLIATDVRDPEPELIVPIGLKAVERVIVQETDDIKLTVYSGNPNDPKTWKGVTGRDFHIETTYATDISFLIKEKVQILFNEEGTWFLKKGERYFIRFSLENWDWKNGYKNFHGGLTDDYTPLFTFDGSISSLLFAVDFTLYYTPLKSKAVWVKVYHRSGKLEYESANGAPPYCGLVNSAGNGYLYLPSDILTARNTGKIQIFYDKERSVMKEVVVKDPRLDIVPLPPERGLHLLSLNQPGMRVYVSTLANEEVVVETTTDFQKWIRVGIFTTDKWGDVWTDYFGPPGFFRAHTVK